MRLHIFRAGAPRLRPLALRAAAFATLLLPSYALLAYVLLPAAWRRPATRLLQPPAERVTFTREGIPSDPLNVALIGSRAAVIEGMRCAGWKLADPISFRSGLRDAHSVLFDRPYETAPVSTQYLWNRPQDLAFEKTVGGSPRRRHHARFWATAEPPDPSKTLWIGAATYDLNVGVSYRTGEVMHHIDEDVDAERARRLPDRRRHPDRHPRGGAGALRVCRRDQSVSSTGDRRRSERS
ncbi:MAG: LssY C-terminal domain-containing protein [Acidobacteria bacterium]|nr:LssY C-terminal domain-containing protein [Acidobacteriota bacterium]